MNKFWLASFLLYAVPAAAQEPVKPPAPRQELQDPSAEPKTMPLWEGPAPGALGDANSDTPTITLYSASSGHTPTAAVIEFPGGGYAHLATNHEGRQIANWLNAAGITAFVVKYRLGPRYHHPVELGDAQARDSHRPCPRKRIQRLARQDRCDWIFSRWAPGIHH